MRQMQQVLYIVRQPKHALETVPRRRGRSRWTRNGRGERTGTVNERGWTGDFTGPPEQGVQLQEVQCAVLIGKSVQGPQVDPFERRLHVQRVFKGVPEHNQLEPTPAERAPTPTDVHVHDLQL